MGLFNKKKNDEPRPAVADMPSLFMTDDSEELVVGHGIHNAGIDPDTSVSASESVDLIILVDLEIQRSAVHAVETFYKLHEPSRIPACG